MSLLLTQALRTHARTHTHTHTHNTSFLVRKNFNRILYHMAPIPVSIYFSKFVKLIKLNTVQDDRRVNYAVKLY